ncbi:riboflavin synthase [Lacibacter sediminis]|uniref:Riboflavin synthase n=1 Tax=Lacibacter sediminis TaxID=2760713 RepID=A0A7G5XK17_9BACT|nr:riboflavin synthase [Lacibacter sediminis]QNA45820.1 riboflavin synthase [Lacibacter sediminis]
MFTGIIEATGNITAIETSGTNKSFWINSPVSQELKVDQSVAHNGVCLTVEEVKDGMHRVTAIAETLDKTNLGNWEKGHTINIERCLLMNARLDGHMVQGHVDTTGTCIKLKELDGSWEYTFQFPTEFAGLLVEKGSIAVNGISLTVFNVAKDHFSVAIIPYTYEHTNMQAVKEGATVNLEFDIIGKYVLRNAQLHAKS